MSYLRKDDPVIVIQGNHKGQTGNILRVLGDRVIIQEVNIRKKHVKPAQGNPGRIIERETSIHISNVAFCAHGKPVKLRVRFNEKGDKELYYLWEGSPVSYRTLSKKS